MGGARGLSELRSNAIECISALNYDSNSPGVSTNVWARGSQAFQRTRNGNAGDNIRCELYPKGMDVQNQKVSRVCTGERLQCFDADPANLFHKEVDWNCGRRQSKTSADPVDKLTLGEPNELRPAEQNY